MSWNYFISKEECIKRMAKHYNKDIKKIRKEIEKNPKILEDFADYLIEG